MTSLSSQIPQLSTVEKLAIMEALWISLHQAIEDSTPPDWHREILENRVNLIQSGEAVYEDWNHVKNELRSGIA